jgi:hypothetical protein
MNPKSECRNTKQIRNPKHETALMGALSFRVSDFVLRILRDRGETAA